MWDRPTSLPFAFCKQTKELVIGVLRLTLVAACLLLLIGVGNTEARGTAQQLQKSTNVLNFFSNHSWLVAPNKEKCHQVPWQKSCRIGRALVEKHTARVNKLRWWVLPDTDNWTRAMSLSQRVFPGTWQWLHDISNRECRACFTVPGAFVCNYEGSGACGPMQFKSGTFYGHMDEARAAVKRRGFDVPARIWSWRHPLGQALVATFMRYTHIDGCHWCL